MQIDVEVANLIEYFKSLQPGQTPRPGVFIKRETDEFKELAGMAVARPNDPEWRVVDGPLVPGQELSWAIDTGGDVVRIPLFPYLTSDEAPETLVSFAIRFGLAAFHTVPRDKEVSAMFIAVGNVFTRHDGQPGHQVWLGYAFQME